MPLFNGGASINLNQIQKYLDNFKPENKKNNLGGLFKIKHKNHFLLIDIDKPPQKKFSKSYQSGPLSFEYFVDGKKIITNSGFGNHISKKAEFLSRLTACQSTLTIKYLYYKIWKNEMISRVFEIQFRIASNFWFFSKNENNDWCSASNNGYEKRFGAHIKEKYI